MLSWMTGLFAGLLGVDELFKQYVEENLEHGEQKEFCGGKVVVRKVYNKGFLLNTLDRYPKVVKGASAFAGLSLLGYDIFAFLRRGHYLEKLGLAIASAGAASNIFDRLVRGKVIDYIGFRVKNSFLAKLTANLGDFYLAIGAFLTALGNIRK